MMSNKTPELIYCAAGNKRYADIALKYGYTYGAQLPNTVYHPPEFADQNWQKPDRARYMAALAKHRPRLATVLDWDENAGRDEVMSWADEAARYVSEAVIIIPKIPCTIPQIPDRVGGVAVRLGYSVPVHNGGKWSGTSVDLWEFGGRPVHLLGGSPQLQMRIASGWEPLRGKPGRYQKSLFRLNVVSADANMQQSMANRLNAFWVGGTAPAKSRYFPQLQESVYGEIKQDAPYLAFELSMMNIRAGWGGFDHILRFAVSEDYEGVRAIIKQYRHELGYVHPRGLRDAIEARKVVVAEINGTIAGFVNYHARRDGWHTVYDIATHRGYSGAGVGSALLCAVPRPIRLKCPIDLNSNDWYRARGFRLDRVEDGRKRKLNVWVMDDES